MGHARPRTNDLPQFGAPPFPSASALVSARHLMVFVHANITKPLPYGCERLSRIAVGCLATRRHRHLLCIALKIPRTGRSQQAASGPRAAVCTWVSLSAAVISQFNAKRSFAALASDVIELNRSPMAQAGATGAAAGPISRAEASFRDVAGATLRQGHEALALRIDVDIGHGRERHRRCSDAAPVTVFAGSLKVGEAPKEAMVHRQQSGCSRGSPIDGFTLASQNSGILRPVIRRLCLTAGPVRCSKFSF